MKLLLIIPVSITVLSGFMQSCDQKRDASVLMNEKQITFSPRTHALDNNDNFSPDGGFLCYDTRGTIYNENLANSKSIEKVEISTGIETIL